MSPSVLMYTTAVCPYCVRAKMLLKARGVTEIEEIRIDLDRARRDEMMSKTQRRTVPQIYIGDTHVGGFDDLSALDLSLIHISSLPVSALMNRPRQVPPPSRALPKRPATAPRTGRRRLPSVSYTHLDVYKRQALQTAPLVKVCQMLGELGGGVFLKLGDANPAVTRFDQLGLYALDLDHLAEQRQFCLLYTSRCV